jgi:hypothetical protein
MSPRYAALRVHFGRVVGPGNWPAIIDLDTHHGVVAYLSDPKRVFQGSMEHKYQGSGTYRCGVCSGIMRHAVAGGRGKPYAKYIPGSAAAAGRAGGHGWTSPAARRPARRPGRPGPLAVTRALTWPGVAVIPVAVAAGG